MMPMTEPKAEAGDAELLPCPFCGGLPIWREDSRLGNAIVCLADQCIGPSTTADSFEDAYQQWNTRLAARPQAAPVACKDFLSRSAEAGAVADDFERFPYDDERFNKGVQHVVDLFAKTLGIDDWEAGDGSENYDDDLQQTLLNIMEARNIYDPETGTIGFAAVSPPPPADAVRTITHFRGEVLQDASPARLIEIAHDLIWESERRRQALAFYADPKNWITAEWKDDTATEAAIPIKSDGSCDCGDHARAAISSDAGSQE